MRRSVTETDTDATVSRIGMEKKKLLFVINSLGCGGAEKSLISLLNLIDYSRYDVYLQMFREEGMFRPLLPAQVNVLPPLPYIAFCNHQSGFSLRYAVRRAYVSVGMRMEKRFRGNRYHDAQKYWKFASGAFKTAAKTYDAAVAWGQGNPTHYVASKVVSRKKIAVINADYRAVGHNPDFDRTYYGRYDAIAAVSERLRDSVEKVFPEYRDRIVVLWDIRNQALIEKMADMPVADACRPESGFVLTTVGRMVALKGYDLAVGAAAVLKSHGRQFRWYFVGGGPELERIRRDIHEKGLDGTVIPVGARDNPYPFMRIADIYVQTSRNEGFCLTLAEARILRVPSVSTDFDVVYGQLRDGENGLIVGMTPEAIAAGIERLADDADLYRSVKEALSREHVGNEEEINTFYGLIDG